MARTVRYCLFGSIAIVQLFVISCSGGKFITEPLSQILLKKDEAPLVTLDNAISNELKNLASGETVVVAISEDGSGILSYPNHISIYVVADRQSKLDLSAQQSGRNLAADNEGAEFDTRYIIFGSQKERAGYRKVTSENPQFESLTIYANQDEDKKRDPYVTILTVNQRLQPHNHQRRQNEANSEKYYS